MLERQTDSLPSPLAGYEHTPFPDVSGLRSNASARRANGNDTLEVIATANGDNFNLASLYALEGARNWHRGTVLVAAWLVLLAHYTPQETSDVAALATLPQGHSAPIRFQGSLAGEWPPHKWCEHVSQQLAAAAQAEAEARKHDASTSRPHGAPSSPSDVQVEVDLDCGISLGSRDSLCAAQTRTQPLAVHLAVTPDQLRLRAAVSVHSLESADLQLRQLVALLDSFVKDLRNDDAVQGAQNGQLPLLAASDPYRLPYLLRAGDNPHPHTISRPDDLPLDAELFQDQFQRLAKRSPDAPALHFKYATRAKGADAPSDVVLSYAELNRRAALVCQHLCAAQPTGMGDPSADCIIALCLNKSPEMYIAQLATLKANAAWCPIDPDWPESRKGALLAKSGAGIVLTTDNLQVEAFLPEGMRVLRLDSLDWSQPVEPSLLPATRCSSSALAYKIWTSGTTGLPKGVGIQHSAAVQALRALQDVIPHRGPIRYLQVSAYVFDLSIMDCFYAWGLGGTICACPRDLQLSDLAGVANAFEATHALLTPALLAMTPRETMPSLQVVINGGEKLTQVVADMWSVDCCLFNLYGPAEATLIAMNRRVPVRDVFKAPNIGVALPTVSCHALDRKGRIVPKGAIGQLSLGGFQCARGYIGDADKTAEKFVQHPLLGRVYMTGDLVRQLADRSFEYLGREDDQIKINGIRIETLEISAIVKDSHPLVKDSETQALALSQNDDDQLRIVNFSVLPASESQSRPDDELLGPIRVDAEAAAVAEALRTAAQSSLPSYMVPSLFVIVSHFPRTSSAKIDRVALKKALASLDVPRWEAKMAGDGIGPEDAEDDAEDDGLRTIRRVVAELCHIDERRIARKTPLASLGLDSIKAIVLTRKLNAMNLSVSIADIAQHRTLGELSHRVAHVKQTSSTRAQEGQAYLAAFDAHYRPSLARYLATDPANIQSILPLTPLQTGMLAETMRSTDWASYWLNRIFTLGPDVQLHRLEEAIRQIVSAVPGCRLAFCEQSGLDAAESQQEATPSVFNSTFVQFVRRDMGARLQTVDLPESSKNSSDSEAEAEALLMAKAKALTGNNPVSGYPPLAFVLGKSTTRSYLLLRAHHSIYDARSLQVFQDLLRSFLSTKTVPSLPDLSTALTYILPLTPQEEDARLQRWREVLAPVPPQREVAFPPLSGCATRDVPKTFQRVALTASTSWSVLARTAQRLETSARPIAQCAWAAVLAAYMETDWVLLGDSISGRAVGPNLEDVFGPLHATVPVPIRVDPAATRGKMVDDCSEFHTSVLRHQHVPLGFVRGLLGIRPDQSLFQSVFVFEPAGEQQTIATAESLFTASRDVGLSVEHPIAVEVLSHADDTITLGIIYRTDVLEPRHADVLLRQFDASLSAFSSDIDASPQDWSGARFAAAAEQDNGSASSEELLSISRPRPSEWIDRALDTPAEEWLLTGAASHPHKPALEVWSTLDSTARPEVLTYADLAGRAQALAAILEKTTPPKSIVAVCLERCINTYVCLLAIQLSGRAYLPLDENLPAERQQLLVTDSSAACVLTVCSLAARFQGISSCRVHCIDALPLKVPLAAGTDLASRPRSSPEDLAYVLYTSGSTGKPKACMLTRRNLSVTIEGFRLTIEEAGPNSLAEGARWLARSAEAFDVALLETFLPLRTGSTIVTGPRALILEDLGEAMAAMSVTHAAVVPSLFYSAGQRVRPEHLPELRMLIVGGEQIAPDIVALWGSSKVPTLNAYGPTETTIGNSMAPVRPSSATGNVGRAFHGSRYAVMNERNGRLVPALRGQPGELCVLGPQVGKGYLGQADASAKVFTTWEGKPLYRTGDLARMTVDDEALYLGRIDSSQVKIRGARLELREIDALLSAEGQGEEGQDPTPFRLNTVLVPAQGQQPARLVAFVAKQGRVPVAGGALPALELELSPLVKRLRQKARTSLPAHMRPSAIVPITYLPLAAVSAKVDVIQLRALFQELESQVLSSLEEEDEASSRPLTDMEQAFAEELRAVLPHSKAAQDLVLRATSDLFAVGLDSLSAISLVARMKRKGIRTTVIALLTHPTLEEAASTCRVEEELQREAAPVVGQQLAALSLRAKELGLKPSPEAEVYPCTPLQESLIAETLSGPGFTYVSRIEVSLAKTVDRERLIQAINVVAQKNPIWRTCFVEIDNKYCQIVLPAPSGELWAASEAAATEAELVDRISTVPPVRFCLAEDAKQLVMLAHHSIFDGVTVDLFLRDVQRAYRGFEPAEGPPFAQAALAICGADIEKDQAFWTGALQDFALTPFPSLSTEQADDTGARRETTLVSQLSFSTLTQAAQARSATSQALVIAAFSSLFAQFTGETDSTFGLVLSGRSLELDGVDQVHGPLITTVPFRTAQIPGCPDDLQQQVARVHRSLLDIYPHQHTSLRKIGQWMQLDRPLFNAIFSFLPQVGAGTVDDIFGSITSSMQTEYPLAVEIQPQPDDSMHLRLVHDEAYITPAQADLLLQQLDHEIALYAGSADRKRNTRNLEAVANPVPALASERDGMVSLFREQVAARPDAIAADFAAQGLDEPFDNITYAELDRLSEAIAADVAAQCTGTVAAVFMQRSILFYATLIAVWKAGKTYMPLDPSLPSDRLRYIAETATAALVLTDEDCRERADDFGAPVLLIKRDQYGQQRPAPSAALPDPPLDRVAYILFTSGSTGKPKGVPISHAALAAALLSWRVILPYSKSSRILQLASASFDVSLIEICMPLAFGFTIASAPKDILLNDLEQTFRKLRLTMADLPASLAPTVHPESVPKLEWLMSGGDAIDARVLREWAPHGLINAWGPTEATIGNTLGFVSVKSKRSLVGTAYPGSSIYVLRPESVDIAYSGALGELAVGGPQIAEGYIGRDDLTAAAFVHLKGGTRVYRTGDRGRLLASGHVEVLGRVARGQVKLRGQRLELDEVSHAFRSQPTVRDADTLYVQHPKLPAKQLVTWISLKDDEAKPEGTPAPRFDAAATVALRECMRQVTKVLPGYMIPSQTLVVRGALPLTPNNKVDHRALEEAFKAVGLADLHAQDNALQQGSEEDQWSREELALRIVVADFCAFPPENVSRTTSFYRLGVDSLSAIRLARAIREAGLGNVAVKDVLRWPSVALLAANMRQSEAEQSSAQLKMQRLQDEARQEIDVDALLFSPSDSITSALPCTPLQTGMIAQSLNSEQGLYYHHHPFKVMDAGFEAVEAAWREVVRRRDILRTTFHKAKDSAKWLQAFHAEALTRVAFHRVQTPFKAVWAELSRTKRPLSEEALARSLASVELYHSTDGAFCVISMHHALYDGNTLPQLIDDLDQAIQAQGNLQQRPSFAELVPHLLPAEGSIQHWTTQLKGYVHEPFPQREPSAGAPTCDAHSPIPLALPEARELAQLQEVSLRTVATFAYAKAVCSRWSRRDIVFGQIFALRDGIDGAEHVLGPAFNTVPTRVRLSGRVSTRDTLNQLQNQGDEGRAFRSSSLRDIQKALGLLAPPFDALMDYQIQGDSTDWKHFAAADLKASPMIQYPVNVEFRQGHNALTLYATAETNVLSQDELQQMLSDIGSIFAAALKHPEQPSDALPEGLPPLPAHDEEALSDLDGAAEEVRNGAAGSAWTELELKLKKPILSVTRGLEEQLRPDTALATLGVDSISAIHLAALIRKEGVSLTVSDIVKGRTIRGLAQRIAARATAATQQGEPAAVKRWSPSTATREAVLGKLGIQDELLEQILPALPGQVHQLASWLHSGRRLGVYTWTWAVRGKLDRGRLQAAWLALRQRHSILRTTFVLVDGRAYQAVYGHQRDSKGDTVEFEDVTGAALQEAAKAKLREYAHAEHSFRRPPVKFGALSSGDDGDEHILALNISHALYDAWSIELLAGDLQALYRGEVPTSTADFSRFVEQQLPFAEEQTVTASAAAVWKQEMGEAPRTLLPTSAPAVDHADALLFQPKAARIAHRYAALTRADHSLPSLPFLFMASWARELALCTGVPHPTFGLYQTGRSADFDGIEKLAAPCLTVLPMWSSGGGEGSASGGGAAALLDEARELCTALERRAPYEQAADVGQVCRWVQGQDVNAPLFDAYLNLIWGTSAAGQAQTQGESTNSTNDKEDFTLTPLKLGNPTDFAPSAPAPSSDEAGPLPSALPAEWRAIDPRLELDVVLDAQDGDHIGVGVRCDAGVVLPGQVQGQNEGQGKGQGRGRSQDEGLAMGTEEALRALVQRLVGRIVRCVESLEGGA